MKRLLGFLLARTGLQHLPVTVRGGLLRGARWTLFPHSAYWRGNYEPEVQAAVARLLPPAGAAAWDLGAHFGYYALVLARAVGPAGCVCAFEPDPVSCARLRRHVALNRASQVRVYPWAAGAATGRGVLIQSEGAGATTSHLADGATAAASAGMDVPVAALDDVREQDQLAPPAFVKIDVEGAGGAALRGAQATLAAARPVLLMSLHSAAELGETEAVLRPLDYAPYDLGGRPVAWGEALFHTVILASGRSP